MFETLQIPPMEIIVPAAALGTVQFLKQFLPFQGPKPKKFYPLLSGIIGAICAIVYQFLFGQLILDAEFIAQLTIYGFGLGLASCGVYSAGIGKGLFAGKMTKSAAQQTYQGEKGEL